MKCCADVRDKSNVCLTEAELTEELFFQQLAALEDGLALLQVQMRAISEDARLFGSFVTHMRQATCPATGGKPRTDTELDSGHLASAQ